MWKECESYYLPATLSTVSPCLIRNSFMPPSRESEACVQLYIMMKEKNNVLDDDGGLRRGRERECLDSC